MRLERFEREKDSPEKSDVSPLSAQEDCSEGADVKSPKKEFSERKDMEPLNTDLVPDVSERQEQAESLPRVDDVIGSNRFSHFDTEIEELRNKEFISDYDHKMRVVKLASLETQKEVLTTQEDHIDHANLERHYRNFDTNQLQLYDGIIMERKYLDDMPLEAKMRVAGFHSLLDGKICIRDSIDEQGLKKVATHETFHDMSYHGEYDLKRQNPEGETEDVHVIQAGFHQSFTLCDHAQIRRIDGIDVGRALNEGYTESLTQQEMHRRGEQVSSVSYISQVLWTNRITDCVGRERMDRAYFGGDDSAVRSEVEKLTGDRTLWDQLIQAMDRHLGAKDTSTRDKASEDINAYIRRLEERR